MISLFIDTSLENVSICIVRDNKILSEITKSIPNMHSIYVTKFVKDALDEANIDANNIDNIMVVTGPGSFTGLRIGVTIAKTYGYLIKKNITPVSSLKILAISAHKKENVMSIIKANKSHYYAGIYNENMDIIYNEEFMDANKIDELIKKYNPYVVSTTNDIINGHKINKVNLDLLEIVKYYLDKEKVNHHKIVPNYLKLPQALENQKWLMK